MDKAQNHKLKLENEIDLGNIYTAWLEQGKGGQRFGQFVFNETGVEYGSSYNNEDSLEVYNILSGYLYNLNK